jgi:hypothetical protein
MVVGVIDAPVSDADGALAHMSNTDAQMG